MYPVPLSQPMVTDRSLPRDKKSARNSLPDSIVHSPERDEIILFAPLQKSPYPKLFS